MQNSRSLTPDDFDIDPSSGELVLTSGEVPHYDRSVQLHAAPPALAAQDIKIEDPTPIDFQMALEQAAQGRKTETITLHKAESGSLGFGVVGLKSEHRGELGIFVQDIQPGGVASR